MLGLSNFERFERQFFAPSLHGDEVYDQVQLLAREVSEEEEDRIESSKVGYSSGGGVFQEFEAGHVWNLGPYCMACIDL